VKNFRIIVLVAIQLLLLGLSIIVFSRIAELSRALQGQNVNVEPLHLLQGLVPLLGIAILIPFGGIMFSIFTELQKSSFRNAHANTSEESQNDKLMAGTDDESAAQQIENERVSREKYGKLKQDIFKCLDSKIGNGQNIGHKQISEKVLSCISQFYEISQGEIFVRQTADNDELLVFSASYAYYVPDEKIFEFKVGEGLIGQVAKAGKPFILEEIPEGYITVKSGLGSASPTCLLICPWNDEQNKVFAVIELATFRKFSAEDIEVIESIAKKVTVLYNQEA